MNDDRPKKIPAMLFQAETSHGTTHVCGYLVYTENGKVRNHIGSGSSYEDPDYVRGDFQVHAYLGNPHTTLGTDPDPGRVWGCSIFMSPHRMDLFYAQNAVKLLRKVSTGLDKLEQTDGYIDRDDFHAYAMRVARILKITSFYVRNDEKMRSMTGELFRATNGAGVQSWVERVSTEAREGTLSFR